MTERRLSLFHGLDRAVHSRPQTNQSAMRPQHGRKCCDLGLPTVDVENKPTCREKALCRHPFTEEQPGSEAMIGKTNLSYEFKRDAVFISSRAQRPLEQSFWFQQSTEQRRALISANKSDFGLYRETGISSV